MVGRAGHDRRPGAEPGRRRSLSGDLADDLVCAPRRGQQGRIDSRGGAEILGPRTLGQVEEAALERPVALDGGAAGEPEGDVVVGAEQGTRALPDLGLVAREPHGGRADRLLRDGRAGAGKNVVAERLAQLGNLLRCPGVVLLDRRSQRAPALVEQEDGRHHAADADRGDLGDRQLAAERADVVPPLAGVLLGPARMPRDEVGRALCLRDDLAGRVDDDRLGRARPDVDTEQRHAVARRPDGATTRPRPRPRPTLGGGKPTTRSKASDAFRIESARIETSSSRDRSKLRRSRAPRRARFTLVPPP